MTPEQQKQLSKVVAFMENMKRYDKIPLDVDRAITRRVARKVQSLKVSAKGANTEDVTAVTSVNFGGGTTTSTPVLNDPDGFLEVQVNGTVYYIPYYS